MRFLFILLLLLSEVVGCVWVDNWVFWCVVVDIFVMFKVIVFVKFNVEKYLLWIFSL